MELKMEHNLHERAETTKLLEEVVKSLVIFCDRLD